MALVEVKTSNKRQESTVIMAERLADGSALMPISSMQKKMRDSFVGAAVDTTKWDVALTGGMTASVAAGVLTIAAGTTINATATLMSVETFTIPFRVMACVQLSQRIANQDFIIEAVSVDPVTLQPDGLNTIAWVLNATTATQGIYRVQSQGGTVLDSAASTILTTASYAILELEPFVDEACFHSRNLDSTTGRANSYVRQLKAPDPTALYKIRIRAVNGGSSPASNTNLLFQFVSVADYAELTAEITAGRGNIAQSQALAVNVVGTAAISSISSALPAGTNAVGDVGV